MALRNVVQEGFNKSLVLPDSYQHDSVLTVEVADVDWDGENEIILGTFGKVLQCSLAVHISPLLYCRKFLSINCTTEVCTAIHPAPVCIYIQTIFTSPHT